MLTDIERRDIDSVVEHYETKTAATVEAMRIVQRERGWVSDEALEDVARHLDISPAYLESLATFYSMIFRRPVGRHVIMVCDSVCCWIDGSDGLVRHLSEKLDVSPGETTLDGRFTLLPVVCLGACDHSPAIMVDGELHGDMTEERLDSLLELYP